MRGTRLPALALIVALVALSVAVVVVIDPIGSAEESSAPSASGSFSPAATPEPDLALLEVQDAQAGPPFAFEGGSAPTGDVAQSKLWFHDGAWWGLLLASNADQFHIHRFDWSGGIWIDTGVAVASRATVQPDVIAEGDQLWIATGGGQPTPRRTAALFRYTYVPDEVRYELDPDFPVAITDEQARGLTMARDASGRLWAAWTSGDGLKVSHTLDNDWVWTDAFVPDLPGADLVPDAVAIVGYGDTVALLWTSEDVDELTVGVPDAADSTAWEHVSIGIAGLAPSDDHLAATVAETRAGLRLYAVVETSLDEVQGSSAGDPQVLLVTIEPDLSSRLALVGRISDDQSRPIVVADEENEVIYVVATSPGSGGTIVVKASSMDEISFPSGEGAPLIEIEGLAALSDATSTKQALSSATGMVVLASDPVAQRYAWVAATLPGGNSPSTDPAPDATPVDAPLLLSTFDPFPVGNPLDPMWEVRANGDATFEIADIDARRVAAVTATADGSGARMCREVAPQASGSVRIEADVMLTRVGLSDATVTSARHEQAQTAVVRLDDSGVFSFFDGAAQVRSEVPWRLGMWYTSVVLIDLDAGTYDWRVTRASDDVLVFAVDGARWRSPATGPMTEVCLESPEATSTASVFAVDGIRVERQP